MLFFSSKVPPDLPFKSNLDSLSDDLDVDPAAIWLLDLLLEGDSSGDCTPLGLHFGEGGSKLI